MLFFLERGSKPWKAIWRTTKSDTLQYLEIQLVHSCLRAKLGIVPFFPHSRQSQSDTRSDTLAIPFWYINGHKSILSQETKKKGNQGRIESPKGHEHRQLQFNFIYVCDSFITISYVHAPNTVKRYSKLRKTIPMSHRAPQLY